MIWKLTNGNPDHVVSSPSVIPLISCGKRMKQIDRHFCGLPDDAIDDIPMHKEMLLKKKRKSNVLVVIKIIYKRIISFK